MQRQQASSVIDTMNAYERGQALRNMRTALRLASLAENIASSARGFFRSAGQAMTLVYGRAL